MTIRRPRPAVELDRRSFGRALAREWNDPALRGSYLMLVNTGITALLGFAFWVAAARLLSIEDVGIGMASVAVITTIANLGQLNLYQSAGVLLAQARRSARRVQAQLLGLVTLTTAGIGVGAVVIGEIFGWFDSVPVAPIVIVTCAVAWSWFAVKDGLLIATGRYRSVPAVNGLYGILKLAALMLALGTGAGAIVWATFVPILLVVPVAMIMLFRRPSVRTEARDRPDTQPIAVVRRRSHDVRFVAVDYTAFIALQACTTLLPFIVLVLAGAGAAGVFAAAWALVVVLDTVAHNGGVPLASGAARAPEEADELGRRVRVRTLALVSAAALAVAVAAHPLLAMFGPAYAEAGTPVLQVFAAASVARAYLVVSLALLRGARRTGSILVTECIHAAVVLTGALLLVPPYGALGMAWAWLIAQLVGVAVVWMLRAPTTRRATARAAGHGR